MPYPQRVGVLPRGTTMSDALVGSPGHAGGLYGDGPRGVVSHRLTLRPNPRQGSIRAALAMQYRQGQLPSGAPPLRRSLIPQEYAQATHAVG